MVNSPAVNFRFSSLLLGAAVALGAPAPARAASTDTAEPMIAGAPLHEVARGRIETPGGTHWVGELFPLTLRVSVARGAFSSVASDFEWAPDDLIFQEWSPAERSSAGPDEVVTRTTRAYLKTPGTIRLPNTKNVVTLVTGYAGDRSPLTDRFIITTTGPLVRLRDLPAPAPAAFTGAVGDFASHSRSQPSGAVIVSRECTTGTL